MGEGSEYVLGGCRLLGNGGPTCGERSCNMTGPSATVNLHCSTLHPIVARLLSPPLGRHSHREYGDIEASAEATEEGPERELLFCQQEYHDATPPGHTPGSPASRRAKKL